MIDLERKIREVLIKSEDVAGNLEPGDIVFSIPPDRKFGDLSCTAPFMLAKKLREKPFVIGNRLIEFMEGRIDGVEDIKLANGGFLNFYFSRPFFFKYAIKKSELMPERKGAKIIVEHTSINPNKSAHIGHLRNSCLGDTLCRSLDYAGYDVEIQNYLDDTGIQLADVVWGVLNYKKTTIEDLKKSDNLASYLWGLYSEVNRMFESDDNLSEQRKTVHKRIEDKLEPEYSMADYIAREVTTDHINVMESLDIRYDLLIRESDIIEYDFFSETADILKKAGIMYLSQDPAKKGCWVIKYRKENIEKIIVRSNGTVTYIGKDIAYTFWKEGFFSRDFKYRSFYTYPDKKEIFISTGEDGDSISGYGNGEKVYNVIDTRQSYLQNIISQIIEDYKSEDQSRRFAHFSYEMVALTPACVKELGLPIREDEMNKTYVEVSGRKGRAVKADELIDILKEKSLKEVAKRHEDLTAEAKLDIASKIAVGALRYFMIKYNANSVIAFDFNDALSFEGDTGPYLQYSLVRINSIFRKQKFTDELSAEGFDSFSEKEQLDCYELLLSSVQCDKIVEFALDSNELSHIPNFAYTLCQKLNSYYHNYPVLSEKDEEIQKTRIAVLTIIKRQLEKLFKIMGIPVPDKM